MEKSMDKKCSKRTQKDTDVTTKLPSYKLPKTSVTLNFEHHLIKKSKESFSGYSTHPFSQSNLGKVEKLGKHKKIKRKKVFSLTDNDNQLLSSQQAITSVAKNHEIIDNSSTIELSILDYYTADNRRKHSRPKKREEISPVSELSPLTLKHQRQLKVVKEKDNEISGRNDKHVEVYPSGACFDSHLKYSPSISLNYAKSDHVNQLEDVELKTHNLSSDLENSKKKDISHEAVMNEALDYHMCERFSESSKRAISVENNLQLDGDIENTRNKATSKIFRAKLKEGIKNCTITSDSQLASETASRLNSNIGLASKRCKKNQSTLVNNRNRIARKHSQICDWLYIELHNSDSDKETSVEKSEIQPRGKLSLKRKRDKKKAKCKSQRSGLKKEQKTVEKSSKSYKEFISNNCKCFHKNNLVTNVNDTDSSSNFGQTVEESTNERSVRLTSKLKQMKRKKHSSPFISRQSTSQYTSFKICHEDYPTSDVPNSGKFISSAQKNSSSSKVDSGSSSLSSSWSEKMKKSIIKQTGRKDRKISEGSKPRKRKVKKYSSSKVFTKLFLQELENHGNVEENCKSTIHHLKTEKLSENSNKKASFPVLNVCKRQNPEKCICFSRDYNNLTLRKLKDTAGSISKSPLIQESLASYNEQYISRHKIKLKCVSSKKNRKQSPTEFEMCYRKLVQPLSKINNQLSWKNSTEDNRSKKTKPKKINFSLEQEGKMAFVSENKGIPHVQDSSEKKKKKKIKYGKDKSKSKCQVTCPLVTGNLKENRINGIMEIDESPKSGVVGFTADDIEEICYNLGLKSRENKLYRSKLPQRKLQRTKKLHHSQSTPDFSQVSHSDSELLKLVFNNPATKTNLSEKNSHTSLSADSEPSVLSEKPLKKFRRFSIRKLLEFDNFHNQEISSYFKAVDDKEIPVININNNKDDVTCATEESIKQVKNIKEMTDEQLQCIFNKSLSFLQEVHDGKIFNQRHEDFVHGGQTSRSSTYQVPLSIFKEDQIDFLMELLMEVYCKKNPVKTIDYILKVLLPMTLIKVHMEITGKSYEESDKIMYDHMLDVPSNNDAQN